MKILVTGASGFVGSHAVRWLVKAGHTVVGVSRKMPGQDRSAPEARYIDGVDVGDPATLRPEIFEGVEAVAHLVGIIREAGHGQTFHRIHVEGTANVVAAAKAAGSVSKFVYVSAIGSTEDAPANYSRTKAQAEERVKMSGLNFVILRPSIILGADGEFAEQISALVQHGGLPFPAPFPFIPVPGSGLNKFQPIYVDDLMNCLTQALATPVADGAIVELGGADKVTFNELLKAFAVRLGVRKPMLHTPIAALMAIAPLFECLPNPPVTRDQLKNLSRDSICDNSNMIRRFGMTPRGFNQAMDLTLPGASKL